VLEIWHKSASCTTGNQKLRSIKRKKMKMDMLRSIGKQSGESMQSGIKKKAVEERFCEKRRF